MFTLGIEYPIPMSLGARQRRKMSEGTGGKTVGLVAV